MGHTKRRPSQPLLESLSHGQVAPVGERSLDQPVLHSEVLEAVVEVGVGHVDGQLLEDVRFLGVKVEPHLREPLEAAGVGDLVGYEHPRGISLVDQLRDLWGSGEERGEMKILNNTISVDLNHTIALS